MGVAQPEARLMTTHSHTVFVIDRSFGAEDGDLFGHPTVPMRLHEVTCEFEDDPTSEDAIELGHVWVDEGSGTFSCPVCGDVLPEAPL
jgi:hypothetical protein